MSEHDATVVPTAAQEAAWQDLLRDLPPGRQPFLVEKARLDMLDPHSRNSILQEQNFRIVMAGYRKPALDPTGKPIYIEGEDGVVRPAVLDMKTTCMIHCTTRCTECHKAREITVRRGTPLEKTVKFCQNCNGNGRVPYLPQPRFCCPHAIRQDPVHPAGLVYTDKAHWVCRDCWKLINRKRFRFDKEIVGECADCLKAEIARIERIDPTKVLRLM